jgi:hypothetical protein
LLEAATRAMRGLVGSSTSVERLVVSLVVGGLFVLLLTAGGRLFGIQEIQWFWRRLKRFQKTQLS